MHQAEVDFRFNDTTEDAHGQIHRITEAVREAYSLSAKHVAALGEQLVRQGVIKHVTDIKTLTA